ncbi:hypothetical protein LLG96_14720 [bacterium]|nr:hypothetical protein [bacterium]
MFHKMTYTDLCHGWRRIFPLIGIAIIATTSAGAQTAVDYFPMTVGSRWVYSERPLSGNQDKVFTYETVVESTDISKKAAMFITKDTRAEKSTFKRYLVDKEGDTVWISMGVSPSLILMDFDPPYIVLPHEPSKVGKSWEWIWEEHSDEYPDSTFIRTTLFTVMSTHETITVPAGTFTDVLKIRMIDIDPEGKINGMYYRYFAGKVGEILFLKETPGENASRSELIEYSIAP